MVGSRALSCSGMLLSFVTDPWPNCSCDPGSEYKMRDNGASLTLLSPILGVFNQKKKKKKKTMSKCYPKTITFSSSHSVQAPL